jgi:hypothetical protein
MPRWGAPQFSPSEAELGMQRLQCLCGIYVLVLFHTRAMFMAAPVGGGNGAGGYPSPRLLEKQPSGEFLSIPKT